MTDVPSSDPHETSLAAPLALVVVASMLTTLGAAMLDRRVAEAAEFGVSKHRQQEPEAYSLMGKALYPPPLPAADKARLEANLAAAASDYERDPTVEDNIVWLGRRYAYLSRYRRAVQIYTDGLALHPDSYKLLRHRGHRHITLRQFDRAIADLAMAAELIGDIEPEIEPDGIPNRLNQPLTTVQFNIWYHLGLAHYLNGDFEAALVAYQECMKVSTNPDLLVATSDWLYMTLRRLGSEAEAKEVLEAVDDDLEVIENDTYHRRLLMYRGEIEPQELLDLRRVEDPEAALEIATQGYGVANWYRYNGDPETAKQLFTEILKGSSWAAFGYIAAEADLHRLEVEETRDRVGRLEDRPRRLAVQSRCKPQQTE